MKYLPLFAVLFFISNNSFAIFCPSNFNIINDGDNIERVKALCGPPSSESNYEPSKPTAQEWTYYIQTNSMNAGTSKMSVVFKDDKVINITIDNNKNLRRETCQSTSQPGNNPQIMQSVCLNAEKEGPLSVASTSACGGIIRMNDTLETVQYACGKPAIINQFQSTYSLSSPPQVTELKYAGPPATTLVFENGQLKDRK